MSKDLKAGDRVHWSTSQGETQGVIVQKVTRTKHVKGHVATPTKDAPKFEIKSEKTRATAIHRPEALKKR